jgi:transcription initiation factor TFIIB
MSSKTGGKQPDRAKGTSGFTCPECGGREVVQDLEKGERICATCGLVVSEHRIDTGPEWRAFTSDEKDARSRAGAPTNYAIHDKHGKETF